MSLRERGMRAARDAAVGDLPSSTWRCVMPGNTRLLAAAATLAAVMAGSLELGAQVAAEPRSTAALGVEPPPEARRGDHADVYHGERVADPYRWMEDMRSDETLGWARAQDAYARAVAAEVPARTDIAERMRRIANVERYGTPCKGGERYFYLRTPATGAGPGTSLLSQEGVAGEPRVVIDGVSAERPGRNALARFACSPDGRFVAYATRRGGSSWEIWRIRDVAQGADLPESLTGLNGGASTVTWSPDGSGFYYERFEVPAEGAEQSALIEGERIAYHRVGAPQERDETVFERPEHKDWALSHGITRDGSFLVVTARPGSAAGNRVFVLDRSRAEAQPVELIGDASTVFTFVGGRGSTLWFQTDRDAPRGRVVAIDVERPKAADWKELIPEAEETIDTWVGVASIGKRFLVGYLRDARLAVKVFDLEGRFQYDLRLPWIGSVWTGFVGRADGDEAFYALSGLADPGSVYRLNVESGESTLFRRLELGYDPDAFVTEQVFYASADGTRVPMFLVHKKGLARDGRAPVFMYGYGSFAWAAAPWFQPHMVLWLEMGGIWALPNIRGGGEYGEAWHRAGSLGQKPVAVDDYVAAAEWLVGNGYTTRELLVANGSSAGGPVVAAALLRRPELFGAVVLDFPALDMLRYDRFTGAASWRYEYGSAEDPEGFAVLRSYSPVHNVRAGTCYPATLVTPGERDETTPSFHAYKFVASLQRAQGCEKPILLRVSWGAGHSYGATAEDSIENWSDQLAFLVAELELEATIPKVEATAFR
jgi:prolyl oligopeptidase